ncbi:hypothetical protein [Paracoccus aminovorans]|uniref:hypothetical protein n=1 Tax=Paracoccus aminovorans TaxID=34004 RepID=UPI002B25D2AA|nr:hypothetical protein [Paracoccus aminovorans]
MPFDPHDLLSLILALPDAAASRPAPIQARCGRSCGRRRKALFFESAAFSRSGSLPGKRHKIWWRREPGTQTDASLPAFQSNFSLYSAGLGCRAARRRFAPDTLLTSAGGAARAENPSDPTRFPAAVQVFSTGLSPPESRNGCSFVPEITHRDFQPAAE